MPASFPTPSAAVLAARGRRAGALASQNVRWQWFIKEVSSKIKLTMRQRVTLATQMLKSRVIQNISRPVTKGKGPRGGKVVTNRSKPGEFPKAETTQLLKTVFSQVIDSRIGWINGYVGTPLDYGVILETRKDRSFLVRTLYEERANITALLTGPIK